MRLTTALLVSSLVIPSLGVGLAPRASRQAGARGVPGGVILREALLSGSWAEPVFLKGHLESSVWARDLWLGLDQGGATTVHDCHTGSAGLAHVHVHGTMSRRVTGFL